MYYLDYMDNSSPVTPDRNYDYKTLEKQFQEIFSLSDNIEDNLPNIAIKLDKLRNYIHKIKTETSLLNIFLEDPNYSKRIKDLYTDIFGSYAGTPKSGFNTIYNLSVLHSYLYQMYYDSKKPDEVLAFARDDPPQIQVPRHLLL